MGAQWFRMAKSDAPATGAPAKSGMPRTRSPTATPPTAGAHRVHDAGGLEADAARQRTRKQASTQGPVCRGEPAGINGNANATGAWVRHVGSLKTQHVDGLAVVVKPKRPDGCRGVRSRHEANLTSGVHPGDADAFVFSSRSYGASWIRSRTSSRWSSHAGTGQGALVGGGNWAFDFPAYDGVKCYALVRGECWVTIDGVRDRVRLVMGGRLVFPHGRAFRLGSHSLSHPPSTRARSCQTGPTTASSPAPWRRLLTSRRPLRARRKRRSAPESPAAVRSCQEGVGQGVSAGGCRENAG